MTLARDFLESLNRFHKVLEMWRGTGNLSRSEFSILTAIHILQEDGIRPTTAEISKKLMLSKPAVSQMMRSLEEKEYTQRSICADDRRMILVEFTNKGRKIFCEEMQFFEKWNASVFERMGKEESVEFIKLFSTFVEIWTQKQMEELDADEKDH